MPWRSVRASTHPAITKIDAGRPDGSDSNGNDGTARRSPGCRTAGSHWGCTCSIFPAERSTSG